MAAVTLLAALLTGQPARAQGTQAACLIGEHGGLEDTDANSATRLVCDELRSRGVDVGQPTTDSDGAGTAYRVEFNRLGNLYYVTLSREQPPGTVQDSRRLQIQGIEEMVTAAPRLADAMVRGVPIEETAGVGTLVGQETRSYESEPGDFFWGIGIMGGLLVGKDLHGGPGFVLRAFYEAQRYGIGGDLRILAAPNGGSSSAFFVLSVGGRFFFNPDNTAFYAGGGFAWHTIGLDNSDATTGVGAYGNVGVELLRLHASRLVIDGRVDVPFFSVDVTQTQGAETTTRSTYVVPVSLAVYYAW